MKFDKSKVYTAVNADEVKVGSKGYLADNLDDLRNKVENEETDMLRQIVSIEDSSNNYRFKIVTHLPFVYNLFYLVEPPEEKKFRPCSQKMKPRKMRLWAGLLLMTYSAVSHNFELNGETYLYGHKCDNWEI